VPKETYLPLRRTFTSYETEPGDDAAAGGHEHFTLRQTPRVWTDVLKLRLAVILGEAGSGKTSELKQQAALLRRNGKMAVFLSLSEVTTSGTVAPAVSDYEDALERWRESDEPGYFFLDSVDESRLRSTAAFALALQSISRELLGRQIGRACVYLSTRQSDWTLPAVPAAIDKWLLRPLQAAAPEPIQLNALALDPLSAQDAQRLAAFFGAEPVEDFWRQVVRGGYEFMATRPLDVQWMSRRWQRTRTLGNYSELIENAVSERLTDHNPGYREMRVLLSPERLRQGAEALAAACVFSNRQSIALPGHEPAQDCVRPEESLPAWPPHEVERLLSTALFDEASYGRVRFHHRATREYLAACWIRARLQEGLPTSTALELFIRTAFSQRVLLEGRRGTLCWLATLHTPTRAEIARSDPEVLVYDGDPAQWSAADAEDVLHGLLRRLQEAFTRSG